MYMQTNDYSNLLGYKKAMINAGRLHASEGSNGRPHRRNMQHRADAAEQAIRLHIVCFSNPYAH